MTASHLALAGSPDDHAVAGTAEPAGRLLIAVGLLTPHPDNPRKDLNLTPGFVASFAESGVLVPLRITPRDDEPGRYWVIDGARRLGGSVKAGLAEVPCDLIPERAGDLAGQFLDMFTTSRQREQLRPIEEADALFAAHQAGASRTRIRKAAGLSAAEVSAALAAAKLDQQVRDSVAAVPRELTLDQLALIAEFGDDPDAVARLTRTAAWGRVEHEAELLRAERADRAEQERLRAELAAAGVTVTDDLPEGGSPLAHLHQDGEQITPDAHASCPGHAAFFYKWSPDTPEYYCADPAAHGHSHRWRTGTGTGTAGAAAGDGGADRERERDARRLVIAGNRAWKAAGEVRRRWLVAFLAQPSRRARRAGPPPEAARFVTSQILEMPEPLRSGLSMARHRDIYRELADGRDLAGSVPATPLERLPLLTFIPLAAAYEHAMTDGEMGKGTWRTDRHSTCPRDQAGKYLAFLAGLGYELSSIEQAMADNVPWTGDTATPALGAAALDAEPPEAEIPEGVPGHQDDDTTVAITDAGPGTTVPGADLAEPAVTALEQPAGD